MTKIDLITGFLGSGKTTFIKLYARYLIEKGENIGILENDYGAVNVDMMILSELEGDKCDLEMVPPATDYDCHKRRFKSKLIYMGMLGYDRVIVEPSGIFDVDEFFDICQEEPINRMYSIGNCITIVDAWLEDNLSRDADFYLASQLANSGAVILSRCQLTDSVHIDNLKNHINNACEMIKLNNSKAPLIIEKDWAKLEAADFDMIEASGYHMASYEKTVSHDNNSFSSVYILEPHLSRENVQDKIKELFDHPGKYGQIFRIKGFLNDNGLWLEVNATRREIDIASIPAGQDVLIVIGENLQHSIIEEFVRRLI